ncbi:hypothetical protein ACFTSF_36255 [Kribbella sp. NPDC056951]|uniref:hypothetical protein n=1 Tax=Kribbella sp. NPDC056951 TaxID=3345978 RepID=UPI0036444D8E
MTVVELRPTPTQQRTGGRWITLLVALGYLCAAIVLLHGIWADPNGRYLWDSGQDQNQWQWFFDVTAHQVLNGQNPLFSTLMNYPLGVNLMANTAMFGLSIPLIPVTVWLGSGVTWALILTLGLAGTAFAWFWMFSRRLASVPAAAVGGLFCGFAPAMISHANAHPNFVVLAVIPLLLLPRPPGRRTAIVVGLLIAYQIFLGEEVLLLAATGLLVFSVVHAIVRPLESSTFVRRYAGTIIGAGVVALAIVALPLAWQFFGPQSYHKLGHGDQGTPLAAFTEFNSWALAGDPETAQALSVNPTEENAFFGWPLLVVVLGLVIALRKQPRVRILGITALILAWLSTGRSVEVFGVEVPGPWAVIRFLPLYDSVVESRIAMVCIPIIGALLAIGIDRFKRIGYVVVAAALLPIVPVPLMAIERGPTPAFFADGLWRDYVRPGHSVVPAPPANGANGAPLQWQRAADFGFTIPDGYFVGPHGPTGKGGYGAQPRPTSTMFWRVQDGGECEITPAQLEADLRYWNADAVVVQPGNERMHTCLDRLLGRGSLVGGIWVWRVV